MANQDRELLNRIVKDRDPMALMEVIGSPRLNEAIAEMEKIIREMEEELGLG